MIFSCEKATLLNAINIAAKALPSKTVNPICEGILFDAKGNHVTLTTTDSSLTVQTRFAAEVSEDGEVVINGKFVSEIIRKMPEGEIVISGDFTKGIEVRGKYSKMNIAAKGN